MGASHSTELDLAVLSRSLIHQPISASDRATWSKLWSIPQSMDECYENFTLELVRNIREKNQSNFHHMMKVIVLQINQIVTMSKQHEIIHNSKKSLKTSNQSIKSALDAEQINHLLNCIRILTRMVSVVNENPQSSLVDWLFGGALPGMLEKHQESINQSIQQSKDREIQEAARVRQEQIQQQENALKAATEAASQLANEQATTRSNEQTPNQSTDQSAQPPNTADVPAQSADEAQSAVQQIENQSSDQFTDQPSSEVADQPTEQRQVERSAEQLNQSSDQAVPQLDTSSASNEQSVEPTNQSTEHPEHVAAAPATDEQPINHAIAVESVTSSVDQSHDEASGQTSVQSDVTFEQKTEQLTSSQSADQSSEQPSDQSVPAASEQVAVQSATHVASQLINQPTNQPLQQSINHSVAQSVSQPTSSSTNQSSNQPTQHAPLDEWWYGSLLDQPLAHLILRLLVDCCFLPGFTIPETTPSLPPTTASPANQTPSQSINPSTSQPVNPALLQVWEAGVGFPPRIQGEALAIAGTQASTHWDLDTRRSEVLRCLLVCFASNMFMPSLIDAPPDRWLAFFVSRMNNMAVVAYDQLLNQPNSPASQQSAIQQVNPALTSNSAFALVLSMLNLLLAYRPDGVLPYSTMMTTDYRQPVVELAAQILMIVLDFGSEIQSVTESANPTNNQSSRRPQRSNDRSSNQSNNPSELSVSSSDESDDNQSSDPSINQSPSANADIDVAMLESSTGKSTIAESPSTKQSSDHSASQSSPSSRQPNVQQHKPSPRSITQSTTRPINQRDNIVYDQLFLHSTPSDLSYLYSCVCRLLHVDLVSRSTWMLGSAATITIAPELFVIMWKFLDESPHFLPHVIEHCDVLELVTPLLFYIYDSRADPSKLGLMYTCVFILLKLSGEREFGVALNAKLPVTGSVSLATLLDLQETDCTYADALIYVAHRFIVASPAHLDASLYGALLKVLLTLLTNVSPYLTRLSAPSSIRILNLVELFTKPEFLYSNAQNHQYTLLLIDFLNNSIQYQFAGSVHLILHIVKRARLFYSLRVYDEGSEDAKVMKGIGSKGHKIVIGRKPFSQSINQSVNSATTPSSARSSLLTPTSTASTAATVPLANQSINQPLTESMPIQPEDLPDLSTYRTPTFCATHAWANSWKSRLPLESVYRVLDFLVPKVETMAAKTPNLTDASLIDYLNHTTLVGVLPVPHPIVVRRYIRNPFTNQWFRTYLFGLLFLRNQQPKLWEGRKIALFAVTTKQAQSRQQSQANSVQVSRRTSLITPQEVKQTNESTKG